MTNCRTVQSKVSAYIDSFLPPKERHLVEAHVALCGSCRRLVREVALLREIASELSDVSPPASLASRIDRIPWESVQEKPRVSPNVARLGFAMLTASAVMLVVLLRPSLPGAATTRLARQAELAGPVVVEVHRLVIPEERRVQDDSRYVAGFVSRGVPLEGTVARDATPNELDRHEIIWQEVRRISACSRRSF